MDFKASDMSDSAKSNILRHIENQVGYSKFQDLLTALGPDALVDVFINQVKEAASKKTEERQFWFCVLYWVIVGAIGIYAGVSAGNWGFLIVMTYPIAWAILSGILKWLWSLGLGLLLTWILGVPAAAAVVGAAFYGTCLAMPWVWVGMKGWWGWLGSHFH